MDLYKLFIEPYESYSKLQIVCEFLAAFFGLLSVYFSVRKKIWVYPTGIISTILYVVILFQFGLLGESLINVYYTVMSVIGWILWYRNQDDNQEIKIEKTTAKEWYISLFLFVISALFIGAIYFYKPYIDANFSSSALNGLHHLDFANWLDIFTTSLFLIGMWMMAKRKLENWIFWIIGDLICIPITLSKGLGITSVQYLVFTVMAIIGYQEWKKSYNQTKN